MGKTNDFADEEMTVELELDNGEVVNCAIVTILEVEGQDYIVLLPLEEDGTNNDGEVWFYRYSENPEDPDEEPILDFIDSDEEWEKVEEAYLTYREDEWVKRLKKRFKVEINQEVLKTVNVN